MKRFARFLTLVGGLGAVLWLLRDRLVHVTVSREPEIPQFVPEPPRRSDATDDLTEVNGVGPTYAERLETAGVTSFRDLAAADTADLAGRIDVPESRIADWQEQARSRLS